METTIKEKNEQYCIIYTVHSDFLQIDQLYVYPAYRGKHIPIKLLHRLYNKYKMEVCLECVQELIWYYQYKLGMRFDGSTGSFLYCMSYNPKNY